MQMLAEDVDAGKGELKVRMTDTSRFEVGVNMAVTRERSCSATS